MTYKLHIQNLTPAQTIQREAGESLLAALQREGLVDAAFCGGNGLCGKCRVRLLGGALPSSSSDLELLTEAERQAGWRLACTAFPKEDVSIALPQSSEADFQAVSHFDRSGPRPDNLDHQAFNRAESGQTFEQLLQSACPGAEISPEMLRRAAAPKDGNLWLARDDTRLLDAHPTRRPLYGLAVDIGTTTLALALVELSTGAMEVHTQVNRQRAWGADVMARIMAAADALPELCAAVRGQIREGIDSLLERAGIEDEQLVKIAVAANTTMLHLLCGFSPASLGTYPFTPVTLGWLQCDSGQLLGTPFSCPVTLLPGISSYVGADIASGMAYTDITAGGVPSLLVDIGTNGEMALAAGGTVYCTSTAAGPALEGGNISGGTGGVPGAICSVQEEGDGFTLSTIGGEPPVGVCGSGVIDAVALCVKKGWVDETGRFVEPYGKEGLPLATAADGRALWLTQKDVREVQLAKSAIRSGIDTLLAKAGIQPRDVKRIFIAGGFGYHINLDSAMAIGLLPAQFAGRMTAVGNSALGGAVQLLLQRGTRQQLDALCQNTVEFSLGADKDFNDRFMSNMGFGDD